jgi:hypothetical protein
MDRQKSISDIMEKLYLFSNFVKRKSKMNIDDINIHAENFYRDLLNILFKYELKNENFKTQNSKAVDLIDDINGVAVRVTLDSKIDSIADTARNFMEEKLYENYDLKILIIGNKRKYKVNKIKRDGYTFHMRNNIIDNNFINNTLADKSNAELQAVLDLLDGDVSALLAGEAKEE